MAELCNHPSGIAIVTNSDSFSQRIKIDYGLLLRVKDPRTQATTQFLAGLLAFSLLFLTAFALYWPILTDFFALDDYIWLQAASNPNPADFFRRAFSFPAGTVFDVSTPFWRPAVDAYFFAAWRIFGLDPLPYHITNVALHGAIASLLALLLWQLTSSRLPGLLGGLLFVVLPTYDFAVTWISSVTELLAALFYLLTLVLFTAYLQGRAPGRWLYWGALGALLLALLSKESAATIPVVLAGLVVVMEPPQSRTALLHRTRELAPFAVLTLAYFVFLYFQEYRSGAEGGLYQFGSHAWGNLWDYLKWMTLPIPDEWASWVEAVRPFAAIAFLVVGGLAIALRRRLLGLAFVWTLVALLPYAFFPAGIEYRYTYLASIPLTIFAVVLAKEGITRLAPTLGPYPTMSVLAVAILGLTVFLGTEARDHQDALAFQAQAYSELFHQVPEVCGDLPPEGHIFLLQSPVFDLFGVSSRMALNLRYEDVHVGLIRAELPGLAAFIEDKCVVQYLSGRYVLETP